MSFFGKIKSAMMGNPVMKEFEVGKHVASAGPGLWWKIHRAVKRSTQQEVSVFVFNKQAPEFEKMNKRQREALLEVLKKGPTQLIKLRHPRLLRVEHGVEESNDCLAFATEPVFASVANLLGHYDNVPSPLPLSIKEHELFPVEIRYGILQLTEALDFLHQDVRMMHGDVTPECVVVNSQGAWKLMGFNFCCYSQYQSEAQMSFQFREWDAKKPLHTNPSLDYLAPEYILTRSCSEHSDIYSLGMVCYAVYNEGRPLFENHGNMLSFKHHAEQISRITESMLGRVPPELKTLMRTMLAVDPNVRPDATQISKDSFFEELGVNTLRYLDMLYQRGDMEKSQFFKKVLPRVVTKLPKRVVFQRVIPPLSEEFRNHKMIPFLLPVIFLIAEDCSMNEFSSIIMPILVPALEIQDPIQVPLIILQKMDLILKKTGADDVKRLVLPMIVKSLEAEHVQLQELCVSIIPTFADTVDYISMKHSIIPRITALAISTKSLSLRVKCLVSLGQMLEVLDKHIVIDHILPVLQQIPSREPGVLMAILGIFHQILKNKKLGMEKQLLAYDIIPFLLPISIEPTLNPQQFRQFMMVIHEMLKKVEGEHLAHLEQLASMEEQTKSTVDFAREVAESKAMDDALNKLEGMFGSLGAQDDFTPPRRGAGGGGGGGGTGGEGGGGGGGGESSRKRAASKEVPDMYDMFAGLLDDAPPTSAPMSSQPLKPSPAPAAPKPVPMATGNKPSPLLGRSDPIKSSSLTTTTPPLRQKGQTQPSQPSILKPTIAPVTMASSANSYPSSSSYTPPPSLQPQRLESGGTGGKKIINFANADPLVKRTLPAAATGAGMTGSSRPQAAAATGWSSGMLTPSVLGSQTGQPGLINSSTQGGTGSSGGGMGDGLFSGMQFLGGSVPTQHQSTQQTQSSYMSDLSSLSQGPVTGPTNQRAAPNAGGFHNQGLGLSDPLVPLQPQQSSATPQQNSATPLGNAASGWSSNIHSRNTHQGLTPNPPQSGMGLNPGASWSSSIAGNSQPTHTAQMGTGWSHGFDWGGGGGGGGGQGVSGMGGIHPQSSVGYGQSMLGGVGVGGGGQSMMGPGQQQWAGQQGHAPQPPAPSPGDNPFADLSFLS